MATEIPSELKGLALYEKDEKLCSQWGGLLPAWKLAYPGVDVVAEVRKAHAWEVSNPQNQKKNRGRFLANWLQRAQDAPRKAGNGPPAFQPAPKAVSERPTVLQPRREVPVDATAMRKLLEQANLIREADRHRPTAEESALAEAGKLSDAILAIRQRITCSVAQAMEILKKRPAEPSPEEYL